jgi:hypothetical protein
VFSSRSRVATFVALATLSSVLVVGAPVAYGADSPTSPTVVNAITWLESVQEPDGGFELSDFQGFETPDAILTIAEGAQTGTTWSTAEALVAVSALQSGGSGSTPLDAIDDWIATGVNAGEAAKITLLVSAPLGIDPADFGTANTDLAALVYPSGCGSSPATGGLFFNELIFVALAGELLCGAPDAAAITTISNGQRADGGWNFVGDSDDDPFPADSDVDTTTLALQALVAGGAAWNDPAVTAGLQFIAARHHATGAVGGFGDADDPNATATAMFAIAAAGFDPSVSCWRDTVEPSSAGTPYTDPAAYLRSVQDASGQIVGPVPNTFATSQSVQGLLLSWWPIARAVGAPTCVAPPAPSPPPSAPEAPALPVVLEPRFTG